MSVRGSPFARSGTRWAFRRTPPPAAIASPSRGCARCSKVVMEMNEHRRYRDLTDDELVELIRGLPRREPRPAFRARVLSAPAPARAAGHWRPAFALAALVVLLFADWMTLKWTAPTSPAGPAPAPLVQPVIA